MDCRAGCVIRAGDSQIKAYPSCQDLHQTVALSRGKVSCQVSGSPCIIHPVSEPGVRPASLEGSVVNTEFQESVPEFGKSVVKLCQTLRSPRTTVKNQCRSTLIASQLVDLCSQQKSVVLLRILVPSRSPEKFRGNQDATEQDDGISTDRELMLMQMWQCQPVRWAAGGVSSL